MILNYRIVLLCICHCIWLKTCQWTHTDRKVTVRSLTCSQPDVTWTLCSAKSLKLCTSPQVVTYWALMHVTPMANNRMVAVNFIFNWNNELNNWKRTENYFAFFDNWTGLSATNSFHSGKTQKRLSKRVVRNYWRIDNTNSQYQSAEKLLTVLIDKISWGPFF